MTTATTFTDDAAEIVRSAENVAVLTEFFKGIASCDYYDGLSHQMYIDTDDNTLSINTEASDNSWLQRDDGSLIQVLRVSGYANTPEDERYTDGCDINDYGYAEWIDQVETNISEVLRDRAHTR